METLLVKSRRKIKNAPEKFSRFLKDEINFNHRLIGILGARGVGKTTLLLQTAKSKNPDQTLYTALDDLFFTNNTLYLLAEQFSLSGGKLLLLDEVHKYPDWSREIKLIYDDFPDMKVIFTSSSVLDIYRGESDLSRRAVKYLLPELSFREFLELYQNIRYSPIKMDDLLQHHTDIALNITDKIKPLKYFPQYLRYGNYPFYDGHEDEYHQKIRNIINMILDVDLFTTKDISYENISKFKRLLYILAMNVPFTPNISKLSQQIKIHRNKLAEALHIMSKAQLINILYKKNKSVSMLNKPDKVWLQNPNLSYAIGDNYPDKGNLREAFFISQLQEKHQLSLPEKGDFLVDNQTIFEVGGKNKSMEQIKQLPDAYRVKDDIEVGSLNTIPLWLFGFLY